MLEAEGGIASWAARVLSELEESEHDVKEFVSGQQMKLQDIQAQVV
jgi:hypothetical protein